MYTHLWNWRVSPSSSGRIGTCMLHLGLQVRPLGGLNYTPSLTPSLTCMNPAVPRLVGPRPSVVLFFARQPLATRPAEWYPITSRCVGGPRAGILLIVYMSYPKGWQVTVQCWWYTSSEHGLDGQRLAYSDGFPWMQNTCIYLPIYFLCFARAEDTVRVVRWAS